MPRSFVYSHLVYRVFDSRKLRTGIKHCLRVHAPFRQAFLLLPYLNFFLPCLRWSELCPYEDLNPALLLPEIRPEVCLLLLADSRCDIHSTVHQVSFSLRNARSLLSLSLTTADGGQDIRMAQGRPAISSALRLKQEAFEAETFTTLDRFRAQYHDLEAEYAQQG